MELNYSGNMLELTHVEMMSIDGGLNAWKIATGVGYTIATIGSAAYAVVSPEPVSKFVAGTATVGFAYNAAKNLYQGFTE